MNRSACPCDVPNYGRLGGITVLVLRAVVFAPSLRRELLGFAMKVSKERVGLVEVASRGYEASVFRRARKTMPVALDWLWHVRVRVFFVIVW